MWQACAQITIHITDWISRIRNDFKNFALLFFNVFFYGALWVVDGVTSWSRFERLTKVNSSSPCLWWCPCGLTEKPTPDPHCSCFSEVLTGNLVSHKETETESFYCSTDFIGHLRLHSYCCVPVLRLWMGNVAWARKFWSLNMSIS